MSFSSFDENKNSFTHIYSGLLIIPIVSSQTNLVRYINNITTILSSQNDKRQSTLLINIFPPSKATSLPMFFINSGISLIAIISKY